ncbi:MAG: IS66 family transposase, partial [Akkermansiaceae bacterium]|nr:IS66 family transposase [Akkermansiaceae bacterium]
MQSTQSATSTDTTIIRTGSDGRLLHTGNLQADETPVQYLDPGKGKTSTGYFWVIHGPRCGIKGDILYQWHSSRKAACLDELLPDYQGNLQTDAYAGYAAWADR